MSEVLKPQKKVRGVGTARGTQRMKFSHEHACPNGLFIGHIDEVRVSEITIDPSTSGLPSFNGLTIPRLTIVFASNEADEASRRYVNLNFTAVESNVATCPGGKEEWKVNTIFDWMKHLLNVYYLKGRELTEEESALLSLDFDDTDENGDYNAVDVNDVISAYTRLFTNFAQLMNTGKDGNPIYKTNDGKIISVWFKLVRYIKRKKGWVAQNNGELGFPTFVGEGCVEIYKNNVKPAIRLDVVQECITPKEDIADKAKAPNLPGAGVAGGVTAPFDPMSGMLAEAADDMPVF